MIPDAIHMRTSKHKINVKRDKDIIGRTAGLWKKMKETGIEYERRLRSEWRKREIK